jgi:hypothetical protein
MTDEIGSEMQKLLEDARSASERARKEHDFFKYMSRLKRILTRLIRYDYWDIRSEDTHCSVNCECGTQISAAEFDITWCSNCGAGYSTQFKCFKYPKWLKGRWPEVENEGG